eukprot:444851_1
MSSQIKVDCICEVHDFSDEYNGELCKVIEVPVHDAEKQEFKVFFRSLKQKELIPLSCLTFVRDPNAIIPSEPAKKPQKSGGTKPKPTPATIYTRYGRKVAIGPGSPRKFTVSCSILFGIASIVLIIIGTAMIGNSSGYDNAIVDNCIYVSSDGPTGCESTRSCAISQYYKHYYTTENNACNTTNNATTGLLYYFSDCNCIINGAGNDNNYHENSECYIVDCNENEWSFESSEEQGSNGSVFLGIGIGFLAIASMIVISYFVYCRKYLDDHWNKISNVTVQEK